jgi:hypothetical protein
VDLIEPAPDRFSSRFAVALAAEEATYLRDEPYDFGKTVAVLLLRSKR